MAYASLTEAREVTGGPQRCVLEIDLVDKIGARPSGTFWTETLTLFLCSGDRLIRDASTSIGFEFYEPAVKEWGAITEEAHIGQGFGTISDVQIILHNLRMSAQMDNSSYTFASGSPAESPEASGDRVRLSQLLQFYTWTGAAVRIKIIFYSGSNWDQQTAGNFKADTVFTGSIADVAMDGDDIVLDITQDVTLETTALPGRLLSDSMSKTLHTTRVPIVFGDYTRWLKNASPALDETNGVGAREAILTGMLPAPCVPAFEHNRGTIAAAVNYYMTWADVKGVNTNWETQEPIARAEATDILMSYNVAADVFTDVDQNSTLGTPTTYARTVDFVTESGAQDLLQLSVFSQYPAGRLRGTAYIPCDNAEAHVGLTDDENLSDGSISTYATLDLSSTNNYIDIAVRTVTPLGEISRVANCITGYLLCAAASSFAGSPVVSFGIYRKANSSTQYERPDGYIGSTTGNYVSAGVISTATAGLYLQVDSQSQAIPLEAFVNTGPTSGRQEDEPCMNWQWLYSHGERPVAVPPGDLILRVQVQTAGSAGDELHIITGGFNVDYTLQNASRTGRKQVLRWVNKYDVQGRLIKRYRRLVDVPYEIPGEPLGANVWVLPRKSTLDDSAGTLTTSATETIKNHCAIAAGLILKYGRGSPTLNTSSSATTNGANFGSSYWADQLILSAWRLESSQYAMEALLHIGDVTTMRDALAEYCIQWPMLIHKDADGQVYIAFYGKPSADDETNFYYGSDTSGPVEAHPGIQHEDGESYGKPYAVWDVQARLTPLDSVFNRFRLRYRYHAPSGSFIHQMYASELPNDCIVYNMTTHMNDGDPLTIASTLGYDPAGACAASQDIYGIAQTMELELPSVHLHHTAAALLNYFQSRFSRQRIEVTATGGTEWYDLKPGHFMRFSKDLNLVLPQPDYANQAAKLVGWDDTSGEPSYIVNRVVRQPKTDGIDVRFTAEQIVESPLGTAWDPESHDANVIEMLEADTVSGSDGDTIQTWTATIGTDGTQATASRRPTLRTNDQNGRNVLQWDSGDSYLLTGLTASSGAYTVFLVVNPDNNGTGADEYLLDIESGRTVIFHRAVANGNVQVFNNSVYRNTTDPSQTGWQVQAYVLDASTGFTFYRNGASAGTTGITWVNQAIGGGIALGATYTGTSKNTPGKYAECIITTGTMSSATLDKYFGYLHHKWGLESLLPATHAYRHTIPVSYA